jgi:hypothetical protein
LTSDGSVTEKQPIEARFSKRKIDPLGILDLLEPIIEYPKKLHNPQYNYARWLEAFAGDLDRRVPLTELADLVGAKTSGTPRIYDRHLQLFRFDTVKLPHQSKPKVMVSLGEPLKKILRQQPNLSNVVIAFEDLEPYAELKIKVGDRKFHREESAETEKALQFLVKNSSLQGITSLIMKYGGEAYMGEKGLSYVSHTANFVQFGDKAQRFFEPIVYTEEESDPIVEVNGRPYKELGFKVKQFKLSVSHFKLPRNFELNKTDISKTVPFEQHYYSITSFRPLQVYSLKYSRKGTIPVCLHGMQIFLCFDFWLAYEESKFTMKWEKTLPITPAKKEFASIISSEWITRSQEESQEDEFKLSDKTRDVVLEMSPIRDNVFEVKTKGGNLDDEMQQLLIRSRVAKPPWRIRFEFTSNEQQTGFLAYTFEGSCKNCPLLKA